MQEVWVDINGFEGIYQISNIGNVRRIKKNGTYRTLKSRNGRYLTVDLSCGTGLKHNTQYIHRLVALHFVPNPNPYVKNVVNHIDGNEHNNNAENLEWVTNSENLHHAARVLGHHPFGKTPRKVNQLDMNGNYIATYSSIGEAVDSIGIKNARPHISECCRGLIVSAYGYIWQYAD